MILMDLTVDGGSCLLVTMLGNSLVGDGGCDCFMDGGVMMTSLVPKDEFINNLLGNSLLPNTDCGARATVSLELLHEFTDGSFGLLHDDSTRIDSI